MARGAVVEVSIVVVSTLVITMTMTAAVTGIMITMSIVDSDSREGIPL